MNAAIAAALSKESAEREHSPEVSCKYRGRGMPQVSMRYKDRGRMRQFRPDYRQSGSYSACGRVLSGLATIRPERWSMSYS
jgi:hypothetical protein